jgi:segregation and condensation protein A
MMQIDATVKGEPFINWPKDLYIPPDPLRVLLEDTFEGPLDLLLYLIKQQNLDILNIPIAQVTNQYLEYIQLMKALRFELAAEYLLMAATLAEIKSRMLLPRPPTLNDEASEEDVRMDLIRKLQAYAHIKKAAQNLDELPHQGIDVFWAIAECHAVELNKVEPTIDISMLTDAFKKVLTRMQLHQSHSVSREILSVRERMSQVLSQLNHNHRVNFLDFFTINEGRMGLVVTFIAILELVKQALIEISQKDLLGEMSIELRLVTEVYPCEGRV